MIVLYRCSFLSRVGTMHKTDALLYHLHPINANACVAFKYQKRLRFQLCLFRMFCNIKITKRKYKFFFFGRKNMLISPMPQFPLKSMVISYIFYSFVGCFVYNHHRILFSTQCRWCMILYVYCGAI